MSQYSISLKSLINIYSHFEPHNDDVFANTELKINRGREIFFNFDYAGDEIFKELFENAFIIKNLEEDIFCLDGDLFILALRNEVRRKAPYFYKKYLAISELGLDDLTLGDKTIRTGQRNNSDTAEEHGSSTNKATTNSSGKTKTSQFPQDINQSADFGNINYMDGGSASDNSSNSNGSATSNSNRKSDSNENYNETTTRNISKIDKMAMYIEFQHDIINDFVTSLNNLFVFLW